MRASEFIFEDKIQKGINIRVDGDIDYAELIADGKKRYETRNTDSLKPYIGKTVAIVRTGKGPATAIGEVTIGKPIVADETTFEKLRNHHLVPAGSKFDITQGGVKYLYPMLNPRRWGKEKPVKHHGIVARQVQWESKTIAESKESFEGITIEMTKHQGPYNMQLVINALTDHGKLLGFVIFNIGDGKELDPQELEVVDQYRGQGIAKVMYDYVKNKGYKIIRSPDQTPDGKYFWDKNRGEEVNVWESEELNEYSTAPKEGPVEDFEGLKFKMTVYGFSNQINVSAFPPKSEKEIARVLFDILDYRQLEPLDLYVNEKYRGQGIAKTMYDYVKSKGYAIHRSWDQTPDGKHFWDKNRGEDVRVWEDLNRRQFIRGLGAAAVGAAGSAAAGTIRDYIPKEIPQVGRKVNVENKFVPETQQLVHDHYVYNRLTKTDFLKMRSRPDFDSTVDLEQVFSEPLNKNVTLVSDNADEKLFWVTPEIFNSIRKELEADQILARNKKQGGMPMAKKPLPTDRLPNTMRQIDPPDPGVEQDRVYRGLGANRPT